MQAVLYPLDRAVIGDVTIRLGMEQSSVFNILGKGDSFDGKRYYYFNGEAAIDFDQEKKVEFIELLFGIDGELQPMIYHIPAFQSEADILVDVLKKMNRGEIDDSEAPYGYGFLEISVGIYRESVPEDVSQMIEEARNDGTPLDDDVIREEMRRATHWATIGIGNKNYYR